MTEPPKVLEDIFERAGLVRQTQHTEWTVTVSAASRMGDNTPKTMEPEVKMCAACGSNNTSCGYAKGVYGKERFEDFELSCGDCGVFTLWQRWAS